MASDVPDTEQPSLFDRIGGKPAVHAATELFYRKVLADPRIAHFFDDVDMDRQLAKQEAFLTMAFGGPAEYTGRDLAEAHAPLVQRGMADEHFDAVVEDLGSTLRDLGVPAAETGEVLTIAGSVRDPVLGR